MDKLIHLIVGARPNYMKIAPLYDELSLYPDEFHPMIIHTGQHYDDSMYKLLFEDLNMPKPEIFLKVGSGTQGIQTAKIIERYETYLLNSVKPDLVIVAGDVNSTIACAIVAKKMMIPIAHLEAGLRSWDESMPEEINRILTDRISDILLTPSEDANNNLINEGINPNKIFFVGNIMIDSLIKHKEFAKKSKIKSYLGIKEQEHYILVTLHRPANVDIQEGLINILNILQCISKSIKIVFPIHPRTKKQIDKFGLTEYFLNIPNLIITNPIGYLDLLKLEMDSLAVLTDSGGIQEETTFLGIPCFTLRVNTERPITITMGTNELVPMDKNLINSKIEKILENKAKKGSIPPYWDGKTAERVVEVIRNWFYKKVNIY